MFPYIGGKSAHVIKLESIFPRVAERFVEVFGGAGWVSVKRKWPQHTTVNVYNDYNVLLANTFTCFKNSPDTMLATMDKYPHSDLQLFRQFEQDIKILDHTTVVSPDYDLAAKYLYLQTQRFSGHPTSAPHFENLKDPAKKSKYDTVKGKLKSPYYKRQLTRLTNVENMDCIDVIIKYDDTMTFFYIDPPYFDKEYYYINKTYKCPEFPKEKHEALANKLANIKGTFTLSYYDFDGLDIMYPKDKFNWFKYDIISSAITDVEQTSVDRMATEIVITNYEPQQYIFDDRWMTKMNPETVLPRIA